MLIYEEDIRNKSRNIFDAYKDLAGVEISISIHDFLELRRSAISEISEGVGDFHRTRGVAKSTGSILPNDSDKAGLNQSMDAAENPSQRTTVMESKPSPKEESAPQREKGDNTNDGDEMYIPIPDEEKKSPFELLRAAKDPWNE